MSTTSRTRRRHTTSSGGATGQQASGELRRPSPQAIRGLDAFARLRRFFEHDAQLAQALGWDESTTAEWRDRRVVRPHNTKVTQVLLLHEMSEEARAYMLDDFDVGTWLNAPLPNLDGSSPARWLRDRRRIGLQELTRGLVDWTPRAPERDLEHVNRTVPTRPAGDDQGVQEFTRMLDR